MLCHSVVVFHLIEALKNSEIEYITCYNLYILLLISDSGVYESKCLEA